MILNICASKIDDKVLSINNASSEFIKIINDKPNLTNYKINNFRKLCENYDPNKCSLNPHCNIHNGKCSFSLTIDDLLQFIQKLSYEIIEQEIKAFELLKEGKYFVSDIVNYNNFLEFKGQKIIKSSNTNLYNILKETFGKEHIPKIGRRYLKKKLQINTQLFQEENPLKDLKNYYQQNVLMNNYSILRAYINGYYWMKHHLYSIDVRNLGYYSDLQNELINRFVIQIIDWLNIPDNIDFLINLDENIKNIINEKFIFIINKSNYKDFVNDYTIKLIENKKNENIDLLTLLIMNVLHNIPICIFINDEPSFYINNQTIIKINNNKEYLNSSNICINIDTSTHNIPVSFNVIYFK